MDIHNQKIEEAVESSKDGSGSDSSYSMTTQSHYYPKRHIISAASSVVSGNSYGSANSTGTSLLSMPTTSTAAMGGGTVAGLQMQIPQQQQQLPFVPKEAKVGQPTSNEVTNNNNALPTTLAPSAMPSQPQKAPVTTVTSKQIVLPMGAPPHPVAEFLFQLTKMLTDNNSEYIEWRNASIVVHNPPVSVTMYTCFPFPHLCFAQYTRKHDMHNIYTIGPRERHFTQVLSSFQLFQLCKYMKAYPYLYMLCKSLCLLSMKTFPV